jgi:hypothetical protein
MVQKLRRNEYEKSHFFGSLIFLTRSMAYFRRISANFYDIKIPIEPKRSSGPRAQSYWSAFALRNGLFMRRRPNDTPLLFSIIPSSSRTLMMMAWKNYSTIIRIQVANAGEAGDEFVGWGGTIAGGDGRYQINTADEKIVENVGGTQQSSIALPLLLAAFSIFSLFKL